MEAVLRGRARVEGLLLFFKCILDILFSFGLLKCSSSPSSAPLARLGPAGRTKGEEKAKVTENCQREDYSSVGNSSFSLFSFLSFFRLSLNIYFFFLNIISPL